MADHTKNTLGAAMKALTDVVSGSVANEDPLANEQLALVVAYLDFVRQRMDLLADRARFEVRHSRDLGRAVLALGARLSESSGDALQLGVSFGDEVLGRLGATTTELEAARSELDASLRTIIREAAGADTADRELIERCVLDASETRIEMERAWYAPLGFDPQASGLPAISDLLHSNAS